MALQQAPLLHTLWILMFDPLENGLMFERLGSAAFRRCQILIWDFDDERRLEVVEHVRRFMDLERVSCYYVLTIVIKQALMTCVSRSGLPCLYGSAPSVMIPGDPNAHLKFACSS